MLLRIFTNRYSWFMLSIFFSYKNFFCFINKELIAFNKINWHLISKAQIMSLNFINQEIIFFQTFQQVTFSHREMEKVDTFFEDIFSIFAFGVAKSSSKSLAFLIWAINVSITLSIILIYSFDENLFISYDALSKITDTIQLFGPIFVHLCNITICLSNFDLFMKIHKARENLENYLKSFNKLDVYKKVQVKKVLIFTFKVIFVQSIGMGIEAFLMIT